MDSDFDPQEMTSDNYDDDELLSAKPTFRARQPFKKPAAKKKAKETVEVEGKKLYMNPAEEKALLSAMIELNRVGWKSGKGWRLSAYEKCAAQIRRQVSGSRVKGSNVDNKLHSRAKQYRLISEFAKRSGVEIDYRTHSVVVDSEDIWKELQEQSNSKFLALWGKFFPYYKQWVELFGQFRATSSCARDHGNAEAQHSCLETGSSPNWEKLIDEYVEDEQQTSDQDLKGTPTSDKSTTAAQGATHASRAPRKKAKVEVASDLELGSSKTLTTVEAVCQELLTTKKNVVEESGSDTKMGTLLKQVEKIEELTFTQQFRVVENLLKNNEQFRIWQILDDDRRQKFALGFVAGKFS